MRQEKEKEQAPTRPAGLSAGGRPGRLPDITRYWLVFLTTFGLLIYRGWDRITHPDLFAEGIRFMGQALNAGWWSLLQPYDFYVHAAPKLIANLVADLVPVAHIPLSTNLACFAITAAAIATIARPGYRWLIPSDGARVMLALLLILAPGLVEDLGNLPNLHWSLLLFLAIFSLKDPKHPLTVWELILVGLTALSSAAAIVFLPVAFLRLVLCRYRHLLTAYQPALALKRNHGEEAFFGILLLVTIYLFAHFVTQDDSVGDGSQDIVAAMRDIDDLLLQLGALFAMFYFIHPFLGTQNANDFIVSAPFYPLVGIALLVVTFLLVRLKRKLDYRFWLVPAWLGSMFLIAIMLSIVRYWAFYGLFSYPYENWWFRYNFIFASTGVLFWFVLIRPRNLTNLHHWPTALILVLTVGYFFQSQAVTTQATPPHHTDAFAITRYEETNYWTQTADELERALSSGCPARVEVAGAPNGKWTFVYESRLSPEECRGS